MLLSIADAFLPFFFFLLVNFFFILAFPSFVYLLCFSFCSDVVCLYSVGASGVCSVLYVDELSVLGVFFFFFEPKSPLHMCRFGSTCSFRCLRCCCWFKSPSSFTCCFSCGSVIVHAKSRFWNELSSCRKAQTTALLGLKTRR